MAVSRKQWPYLIGGAVGGTLAHFGGSPEVTSEQRMLRTAAGAGLGIFLGGWWAADTKKPKLSGLPGRAKRCRKSGVSRRTCARRTRR